MQAALIEQAEALQFILAGKANFTAKSQSTGVHFTYKVEASDKTPGQYFVKVMTGPDNSRSYSYIGLLFSNMDSKGVAHPMFKHSPRSRVSGDAKSVVAFAWIIELLADNARRDKLELWHTGSCCRCGRKLTTPESVALGIGPECGRRRSAIR